MAKAHTKLTRNNNRITLASVATKPMPLTDNGKFAYYYMQRAWADGNCDQEPLRPEESPVWYSLTPDDHTLLRKAWKRAYEKYAAILVKRRVNKRRYVYELILNVLKHRRYWRRVLRTQGTTIVDLYRRADACFGVSYLADLPRKNAAIELGRWLKQDESRELFAKLEEARRGKTFALPFWDRQPLYACAGELEARTLRSAWTHLGRYITTRRVTGYRTDWWHVGRDGGGQPEIRFAIQHKLPDLACRLVYRLGSIDANGGHIHMNCKRNEDTARTVYYALRYNLSWFRYLAPMTRRRSRWCAVSATGDFASSLVTKFAAVSCSQFGRLGTVEVRLWPTSSKPADWRFRAQLMQAIARWSEENDAPCVPVDNLLAPQAWEAFYRWAAIHQPEALKAILRAMKAKVRSLNSRRATDRFGAVKCDEFVRQFDASDVRLRGYRRVSRPVPAAAGISSCEDDN